MRQLLLVAIVPIVLISMCADIPFLSSFNTPLSGTPGTEFSNEEISMTVNVLPTEVNSGGDVTLYFQVTNNANYDLKDVGLLLYDPCIFNGGSSKSNSVATLKSNRSMSWSWDLTSSPIALSRDCEMKFRLYYTGKYSAYQDVAVLDKTEYNNRLLQNTLNNIPISSSSTKSPLRFSLTFTEDQPFLTGTQNDLQIGYAYGGEGFVEVKDVTISVPSNLAVVSGRCVDYDASMKLTRTLKFINKKATSSVCSFTAQTTNPVDIKSMTLNADYNFYIDGSVLVSVKGTSPSQPLSSSQSSSTSKTSSTTSSEPNPSKTNPS